MSDEVQWDDIPYEMRMAATAYIMGAMCEHAKEGGTYRYLIYERLGFGMDAYATLYGAGGMTISNEFVLGDRNVTAEDAQHAKLVEDWAMSIMPAPSPERSAALDAAFRFRGALEALAKQDDLRERRVAEALAGQ